MRFSKEIKESLTLKPDLRRCCAKFNVFKI